MFLTLLASCLFLRLVINLYFYFTSRAYCYKAKDSHDAWAVVTGCTDGIGFEFALQLAQKGYKLLLLSRDEEKLQRTMQEICSKLPSSCQNFSIMTHCCDFSKLDIYDDIEKFLNIRERNIEILVNNVGVAMAYPDYFINSKENTTNLNERIINVNLIATTRMIELVLPSMIKQAKGLILNVSSFSTRYPNATLATYASTKAYVQHLSLTLAEEYRSKNVLVYCLSPSFISTKMVRYMSTNWYVPNAQQYVRSALDQVKWTHHAESTGYWSHDLIDYLLKFLALVIGESIITRVSHWHLLNMRKQYLSRKTV